MTPADLLIWLGKPWCKDNDPATYTSDIYQRDMHFMFVRAEVRNAVRSNGGAIRRNDQNPSHSNTRETDQGGVAIALPIIVESLRTWPSDKDNA